MTTKLTEIGNILRRLDDPIIEPSRARDFLELLEEDPDTLHYEPALAAAAMLSFYWGGMKYPDGGLNPIAMHTDITHIEDLLRRWTNAVLTQLRREEFSPAKEGLKC